MPSKKERETPEGAITPERETVYLTCPLCNGKIEILDRCDERELPKSFENRDDIYSQKVVMVLRCVNFKKQHHQTCTWSGLAIYDFGQMINGQQIPPDPENQPN